MPTIKIMLVGDSNVGKTAIQKRYCIVNKVDKFCAALIHEIEAELRQLEKAAWRRLINHINEAVIGPPMHKFKLIFLMNKFCTVNADFIRAMLVLFDHALVPVSIACFFAENGYANKFQKLVLVPCLSKNFWLRYGVPLQQNRQQSNQIVPPEIDAEFDRYTQLMRKFQEGEYSALLTVDLKLSKNFCPDADEYVPTYVPTTNIRETENGDMIVCDMPSVVDWERFSGGFMPFGPMIDAIILVYDIGNRNSFDRIQHYRHQLKEIFKINTDRDGVEDWTKKPLFMLAGNKCDFADDARQVSREEGKSRAIYFDMPFMEVSASKNTNIESAFITLAEVVKKKRDEEKRKENYQSIIEFLRAGWSLLTPLITGGFGFAGAR